MHIHRRKDIREREKLVTPPIMKITIGRATQETIKKTLKPVIIHQIIDAITNSPKLNKKPHETQNPDRKGWKKDKSLPYPFNSKPPTANIIRFLSRCFQLSSSMSLSLREQL